MLLIPTNPKGLTLTELLVAAILMGIVMVGLISVNYAIRRMENSTSEATILAMQTAAAMRHITRNGLLAVGHEADPGIRYDLTTPPSVSYLSFRQDVAATPADFTDDIWVIYTDAGEANRLYTCRQSASTGPEPGLSDRCSSSQRVQLLDNVIVFTYQLVRDITVPSTYLEVNLQTQYDVSQPFNPTTNPRQELSVQINPPSHSWSP